MDISLKQVVTEMQSPDWLVKVSDTLSLQKCITNFVTKLYHQGEAGRVGFGRY